MIITYEQSPEAIAAGINAPAKAHERDSGFDIFSPQSIRLFPGERITVDLQVRFALQQQCTNIGIGTIGVEALIRPKSGRSKNGLDVELGTIDNGYRGYTGATITNTTNKEFIIEQNEKLCQIVFAPVFQGVQLVNAEVSTDTERGESGFGDSGLV